MSRYNPNPSLKAPAKSWVGDSQRELLHRGQRAFTVTELLVAVSLMTVIVLALYSMFNQTQKAMRANEAQVDSTERGRGVLELVSREIESARPGLRDEALNLFLRPKDLPAVTQNDFQLNDPASSFPMRTNSFDDVYYLTKADKAWRGVGYVVLQSTNTPGVGTNDLIVLGPPFSGIGTLYRYETPPPLTNRDYAFPSGRLFTNFFGLIPTNSTPFDRWPSTTNFSLVAEGVVHFKALPFDSRGQLMSYATTNLDSNYRLARVRADATFETDAAAQHGGSNIELGLAPRATVVLRQVNGLDPLSTTASFRSNALPAYVELELGVLEPETLRTYRQMLKDELPPAQVKAYLERRVTKVQIFRKRIPFRTVAQ